jgi:hypothetical protein
VTTVLDAAAILADQLTDDQRPGQWPCQDEIHSSLNYLSGSPTYRCCTGGGGVCGRNERELLKRKTALKKWKTAPRQTVDYG